MNETLFPKWYLLFDGSSPDGRGEPSFVGRTTKASKAKSHYEKCSTNPYSTGKVMVVTDGEYRRALSDADL